MRAKSTPTTLAGKILSASAPAATAASASVGVIAPTNASNPFALARRTTAASVLGATMSRAPVAARASTSATVRTVPAPTATS